MRLAAVVLAACLAGCASISPPAVVTADVAWCVPAVDSVVVRQAGPVRLDWLVLPGLVPVDQWALVGAAAGRW